MTLVFHRLILIFFVTALLAVFTCSDAAGQCSTCYACSACSSNYYGPVYYSQPTYASSSGIYSYSSVPQGYVVVGTVHPTAYSSGAPIYSNGVPYTPRATAAKPQPSPNKAATAAKPQTIPNKAAATAAKPQPVRQAMIQTAPVYNFTVTPQVQYNSSYCVGGS